MTLAVVLPVSDLVVSPARVPGHRDVLTSSVLAPQQEPLQQRSPLQRRCRRKSGPTDEFVQLVLPGCEPPCNAMSLPNLRSRVHRARRYADSNPAIAEPDALLTLYRARHAATATSVKCRTAYAYQLRTLCRVATTIGGRTVTLQDLFCEPAVLGRALVADRSPHDGKPLARQTLSQRRSAIRSFATLLHPELHALLGDDPHRVLDQALRLVAERVGTGYRLTEGTPSRRGGYVPTAAQIAALMESVGQAPGYHGVRNQLFIKIATETGVRVTALRTLDGRDCIEMPCGDIRLMVSEKGKDQRRELELSQESASLLHNYQRAYNRHAAIQGWRTRVGVGQTGPIWRNSARGTWPDGAVRAMLRDACTAIGMTVITPHALRRYFATTAASDLPRYVVAQAGGWSGVNQLDIHYIWPHADVLWRKLTQVSTAAISRSREQQHGSATVPV